MIDATSEVVLGLPVFLDLRIGNRSGEEQNFPFFSMRLHLEIVSHPEGPDWWFQDMFQRDGYRINKDPDGPKTVAAEWETFKKIGLKLPCGGVYTFKATLKAEPSGRWSKVYGEILDHWIGEVSSELITVTVKEPQGIDAEAFQAVCALAPEKLVKKLPPAECYRTGPWRLGKSTGAQQLLLTKYLESTYAGYEIYKQYGKRWTGDADYYQRWATPSNLSRIRDYGWCDASGDPNSGGKYSEKLVGEEFLRCRDHWLQIALENHPDIWFSDDIRLVLAGDAYLLGDKARCRALLERLAAKGRPFVAMRARELLDDMIEKNMLPAPTPKPGFAGGRAR